MTNYKSLLLAASVIISVSAAAQNTQKFTAAKHNDYGLTYSLPTTHISIQIEAEHVVKKAGPYYKYAKKYLGTTDVVKEDSEEWTLKNAVLCSYGVPDSEEKYLMQFKSGQAPFVLTTDDGLLLSLNTENVKTPEKQLFGKQREESILESNKFSKSLPGELLVSESTAKRAEIAANLIYQIRESRTNYATGEVEHMPDGDALKIILKQLDDQEAALTALFVGTTSKGTAVRKFDFLPDTTDVDAKVVARISDFNGISDPGDLSGEPVYLEMKITDLGELPVNEKGEVKKMPKNAIIYTIPGKAQFTLRYKQKEVARESFSIAQLGITYGLDPSLISDKKAPSYVKFASATGSVLEIGPVTMQ